MTKQVKQGTAWETEIRKDLETLGFATRTPKTGLADEPDIILYGRGSADLPIVAWKQLRPGLRNGRRLSHKVVVLNYESFVRLLGWLPDTAYRAVWVQAKATERLNAPAILRGLMAWVKQHGKVPHA